ncbi:MAG: hypothetical protein LBJ00_11650 [Planctomycetaceae bacterium]|nr:hypothetical protein [Planctomycetaceae bacterium]
MPLRQIRLRNIYNSVGHLPINLIYYTVAGKAIGFALEQPLHVVTLA